MRTDGPCERSEMRPPGYKSNALQARQHFHVSAMICCRTTITPYMSVFTARVRLLITPTITLYDQHCLIIVQNIFT
jgi:hypothetical protein